MRVGDARRRGVSAPRIRELAVVTQFQVVSTPDGNRMVHGGVSASIAGTLGVSAGEGVKKRTGRDGRTHTLRLTRITWT